MPDIFLSYSREDQAIARRYAEALEREGFGVWWDVALNPGETFDKVTVRHDLVDHDRWCLRSDLES